MAVSRAQFDAAAITIFNAFGDLIEDVTLSQPGAWDPITETQTPTTESIRVARREFTRQEADGQSVMVGDLEAMAIISEVTATPKIDDTLIMDGVNYLVRGVGNNQGVIWRLHLRRL
jgi:uncharacterized protein with von Willebrand factor type A (vWA) domain